ncbi:MAG TPA: amidohydrolase family protein [Thermomicrobiaceae bacterium]|nr:amidohydrolase family protein [Thermomicrobiaceae bacterium]
MRLYDAQVRLGDCLYGYSLRPADLLASMERCDIGRAVLCPARPRGYDLGPANDLVAQAVSAWPDRFVGFARVDPWRGEAAVRELDRAIQQLGFRGLFLDPWEEHFVITDPIVYPIVEAAAALRLPVMIAGGYPTFSHPSQIAALARRFPEVTFIATHAGQINISGLLLGDAQAMMRACPNVIAETSGVYREDFIEDCIAEFGPGRVLWGSGAPIFDQAFETLRARMAHVSDAVKQQVGWDNIARLVARSPVA